MLMRGLPTTAAARPLLVMAICAAAAAGCGTAAAPAAGGRGAPVATSPSARASLEISVSGVPGARPRRWTLRCDPAGEDHPDPAAACRALIEAGDPFARRPGGTCPLAYIPAGTAEVTGIWFGRRVHETWDHGDCGVRSADRVIDAIFG